MEWLILAIVSWILLLLLADWKKLKKNIWCAPAAIVLQYLVDSAGTKYGLYEIHKYIFFLGYSALLFVIGPVTSISILLSQYHPEKRTFKIFNVFVLAGLYTLQEVLLNQRGAVVYKNWSIYDSMGVNISAMIILSWFSMVILKKDTSERKGQ